MKKRMSFLLSLVLLASATRAADTPSLEMGRELFATPRLGTSGQSCIVCHPEGRDLESTAGYGDGQLTEIIATCIAKPLKGKPLAPDSVEMKSLILYLRDLVGKPTS